MSQIVKIIDEIEYLLSGSHSIFIQISGPTTIPIYLGCHSMEDVEQDQGDISLFLVRDPEKSNKWSVTSLIQDTQDVGELAISNLTVRSSGILDQIPDRCPFAVYSLVMPCSGRMDIFSNWDAATVFHLAYITSKEFAGLTSRSPEDQEETVETRTIQFTDMYRAWRPSIGRQDIEATVDLNAIALCQSGCRNGCDICQSLIAVGDSPDNVWWSSDGGASWESDLNEPFTAGEDVQSIICFDNNGTTRYITAQNGTTVGNDDIMVYRDGLSGSWTPITVEVTSILNGYAATPESLMVLDRNNIYFVSDLGFVARSTDGGETWSSIEPGAVITKGLYAIDAASAHTMYAVGEDNTILYTLDGWETYTEITAQGFLKNILSISIIDKYKFWIADDGGYIRYTKDGGDNFAYGSFDRSGTGECVAIEFINEIFGFMIHNDPLGVGRIYQTIDGGYNWQAIETPDNNGLNAMAVCDQNLLYVVGETKDGSPVVFRVGAQPSPNVNDYDKTAIVGGMWIGTINPPTYSR